MGVSVDQLAGKEVRGWLLTEVLGRGADGIVYCGAQADKTAAVKIFFPENLEREAWSGARERLDLQLSLKGEKHHPNLVEVIDGGELDEFSTIFLVMEHIQGTSLDKLCGAVPAEAVERLVIQLASACEYLESKGLIHRDIKPANIVVSDDFEVLTLLDFGVIHDLPSGGRGRLSGDEFVATTRYSPPEFVWRKEEEDVEGWRAVSFYQIGATLHDMIMGYPLFSGYDKPSARLYDAVRDRTPDIQSSTVPTWVVDLAQTCLLKDWRQRTKLLSWTSFTGPQDHPGMEYQERRIRLRQLRQDEKRRLADTSSETPPAAARLQLLWALNTSLIHEVRTYLFGSEIFPKCGINEVPIGNREYLSVFKFDPDRSRGFPPESVISIRLSIDDVIVDATNLHVDISIAGKVIKAWSWTEMFSVEAALTRCQQALIEAVDIIMAREDD